MEPGRKVGLMSSDKKNNIVPLISTIAVAAAALIAAVILLITMNKNPEPAPESMITPNNGFVVTAELYGECESAAKELVSANYEVIRLFVTEGLPLKKVYGKDPEPIDGAYEVASSKYTEYSQIEELVKGIYTDEAADEILKRTRVSQNDAVVAIQPYSDHNINGAVFLGLNTQFAVDENYKTDWSNCFIMAEPQSEDRCMVTIYVNGISAEDAESHPESVLKVYMNKTADGWRLAQFLK